MKQVFVSYADSEAACVNEFAGLLGQALKAQGVGGCKLWMARHDIPIGVDYDQAMREAMQESDVGLLLLSENWLESRYVLEQELPYFLNRKNGLPVSFISTNHHCEALRDAIERKARSDKQGDCLARLLKQQFYELNDGVVPSAFSGCVFTERKLQFVHGLASQMIRYI